MFLRVRRESEHRSSSSRLAVRPRDDGRVVDLVSRDDPLAPPVATVATPTTIVLLDALCVAWDDGSSALFTSEYEPAVSRSRVRRWDLDATGTWTSRSVGESEDGEILWWLAVREGAVVVREIRTGRTYRIATAAVRGDLAS